MEDKDWGKSGIWAEGNEIYQENKKQFLSLFDGGGGALLDLGCRDGEFTKEIAERVGAKRVCGIDLSEENVQACRMRGIDAAKADLNGRFPYGDQTFDAVSAHQVLEHLWDTKNFFSEVRRVLKPGGYAVLSTPNLSSLHSIAFIILGWQPTILHLTDVQVGNPLRGTRIEQPGHNKAFNYSALKDLAVLYGLQVEKITGFGFYFTPVWAQRILSKPLGRWAVFTTAKLRRP